MPRAKMPRTTDQEAARLTALMPRFQSEKWTEARLMTESGLSRSRVRIFLKNGGTRARLGRPPFFTPEEEALLAEYLRVHAIVELGLTRLAFRLKCSEYIATLLAARREAAGRYFGGNTIPGKAFIAFFLRRWPDLRKYCVGTLEMDRARNSRRDVLARWCAALTLLYRDERIVHARQVWNMDETAIRARDVILHSRQTILGGKGLTKPESLVPDIGSAKAGCTAAFTISASGDTAPTFVVVAGGAEGHAFVRVSGSDDSPAQTIPLASRLPEGSVVVRRNPAGFDRDIFDKYARHFTSFARSFYPIES